MIKLFLGVPGAGKTQAMIDFVRMASDAHKFFVVDRANEWLADSPRWRGEPVNRIAVPQGVEPEFFDRPGVYCFGPPWEGLDVAALMRRVGNAVYVDDEIDLVATYSAWRTNPLRDFVHRGRHLPNQSGEPTLCHVFGAARRVQNLHGDLTSLADEVYLFRLKGKHTLSRVVEEGWLEDSQLDTVRTFPNLRYFRCTAEGDTFEGILENPFQPKKG